MALRWLVTREVPQPAALVSVDVWDGRAERLELAHEPDASRCRCCVERRFDFLDSPLPPAAVLCGRNAVMLRPQSAARPTLATLAERVRGLGEVLVNEHLLRLRTGELELTLFADGRIVVKGTGDLSVARAAAAQLLGI
jgi:adenylyltransferase/sulfurtransferase